MAESDRRASFANEPPEQRGAVVVFHARREEDLLERDLTSEEVLVEGAPDPACTAGRGDEVGTCKVRHELDQITSRFPSFKQLESTSWCGIDAEKPSRSLPSQNNIRLVGVLNAVDDQAVLKELGNPSLDFKPVAPESVPPEIVKLLPEGAEWMMSDLRISHPCDLVQGLSRPVREHADTGHHGLESQCVTRLAWSEGACLIIRLWTYPMRDSCSIPSGMRSTTTCVVASQMPRALRWWPTGSSGQAGVPDRRRGSRMRSRPAGAASRWTRPRATHS
ncbi:hypothetical protein ACFXB3_26075 [Streptomyces sp. NPDC059447]|uniref:hypothetical protein n=1 Tax=Streptomyces sp. NPDC059447 TaxID=3346834 RepID=UPI0036A382E2